MWLYFRSKKWALWAWGGLAVILAATYAQVLLDVAINKWFGSFYDTLQEALTGGVHTAADIYVLMGGFTVIAMKLVLIFVGVRFFASHWCFRWRTSMTEYFHDNWKGHIEGASQRVQEDTIKLARIMETLGVELVQAIMVVVAFLPELNRLSAQITELPFFGQVEHSLVWLAVVTALGGTVFLALVGIYLPTIEYRIQAEEAAYRKELVLSEDGGADVPTLTSLYARVKRINYVQFWHYTYFDAAKISFLQGMVVVPYIALAPTIVSGAVTLGFVSQISRAFGKVAESLQYLVRSWSTIVELISIHKRLREFEDAIKTK